MTTTTVESVKALFDAYRTGLEDGLNGNQQFDCPHQQSMYNLGKHHAAVAAASDAMRIG